jgi:cobalt-zinc-cadmium efflux system membrane fusion protein
MNARIPIPGPLAWAAFLLVTLAACGGQPADPAPATTPDASVPSIDVRDDARSAIGLQVTELQPQSFSVTVQAPGTVRADQDATAIVGPIVEGRIREVLVGWGDRVARGQVLAWLDSVAAGEAKAAHFRSRAALDVADARLKRMQLLSTNKIVATKDLKDAEAELATAQADAAAADDALQLMGYTDDDVARFSDDREPASRVPLVSPLDGAVVERNAVVGAWAAPPDALFTIMDLGRGWVDAEVYEKDLAALRPGQPVTVSVVAWPDRTFSGQVGYIGGTVDESRRTIIVRTVVANPDGLLKPGMFATVGIVTRDARDTLLVPEGAVLQGPRASQVVVEEDGRYRLRDVQVGAASAGRLEIVGGLSAGERVVTGGQNQIAAELATAAN